jgi:hypothetical protein
MNELTIDELDMVSGGSVKTSTKDGVTTTIISILGFTFGISYGNGITCVSDGNNTACGRTP